MSIFSVLFKKKKDLAVSSNRLVNLFTPYFSNITNPKLNDTFMSCIYTHAKHLSKIKPVAVVNSKESKPWLTKILSLSPNSVMESGVFWEKVAINYYLDNNVFIYLDWNLDSPREPLRSMWILDPGGVDVRIDEQTKQIYLRFSLNDRMITTGLDNIVHLARNVTTDEIFGKPCPAINAVLRVINTNYEGIEQAIKTSAFLRFVITSTTLLSDKDKQKKAQEFADTYLAKDGTGIAYLDASSTLTQVNSQAKYANAEEMTHFEKKIFRYLNISDEILVGNFTEDQWQSYSETNIEPFINKLKNQLDIKLFTENEFAAGNRVVIASDDLAIVSMKTKIQLVDVTKELGLFTINEYRRLFNMSPLESGDTRLVSLNYIDSEKSAEYQLNKSRGAPIVAIGEGEGGKENE